jgi:D-alanyl-D-alanine carboxypeptidase
LDYEERVSLGLAELGIPPALVCDRRLPLCLEAEELVVVEIDIHGREHRLIPSAADAWKAMKTDAGKAGIEMQIVSAFRSFERQVEIIREKIEAGQSLAEILSASAPPGYSEHHTGRAVDIGCSADDPLEEDFEQTAAYSWLVDNAAHYRYFLSFPRNNMHGYRHEPWHWIYRNV